MRVVVVVAMVQSQHETVRVSDRTEAVNPENSMQLIGIADGVGPASRGPQFSSPPLDVKMLIHQKDKQEK